jgi:hypothetical protein
VSTPLEAILEYYRVFSTLDVRAIVAHYCEPSTTIAPHGVLSAASRGALAESLAPIVKSLQARGYGRSEFVQPQITMLGQADALVRGIAIRFTAAGSELERIPISYLMHRIGTDWRIAVLLIEQ